MHQCVMIIGLFFAIHLLIMKKNIFMSTAAYYDESFLEREAFYTIPAVEVNSPNN